MSQIKPSQRQKQTLEPQASFRADVYTRVTRRIIEALEQGVRPWMKLWSAQPAGQAITQPLRHNGTRYRGLNVMLLWCEAFDRGFSASMWMTYKQARALGVQVRKGETGSLVVYADQFTRAETDAQGEDAERVIPFMKGYTVFNLDQIEGLPDSFLPVPAPTSSAFELHQAAETFFAKTGAAFRQGGHRAFYSPGADFIQLPSPSAFREAQSYAAVKAHELIHWTGHESRNARQFGQRFGDEAYAREELVAELGSAFLCTDLGIMPEVQDTHAAYLGHWLRVLTADKRAIFAAAWQAQTAADFPNGLVNPTLANPA